MIFVPVRHTDPALHRRLFSTAINWLIGSLNSVETATDGQVLTADGNGGASFETMTDYALEVSKGNIPGTVSVNKFGRCPDNVDSGIESDIWDGAAAATGVKTWIAPTIARIHAIASSSANDTAAGTGARTIQVYGLVDWDTAEVNEVVTLNGTTNVNTVNSYVIIHRMKVISNGGTFVNDGAIAATAATDGTITSQINPMEGQTQMAVYGMPSTQTLYMTKYYASVARSTAGAVDINFKANTTPDTNLTTFLVKSTSAIHSTGATFMQREFEPPMKLSGPCIFKVVGTGTANNMDVSAGFDGYLVDN